LPFACALPSTKFESESGGEKLDELGKTGTTAGKCCSGGWGHSSWAMVKDDIQLLFIWHEILSRQTTVIRQVLLRVLFMEK